MNLKRLQAIRKTGNEEFHHDGDTMGFDLKGFWQWSASDLVSNTLRGVLAEYIVAKSLNIADYEVRTEWAAFDLITPDGIKIEVKSASYLQSWHQRKLSEIAFRIPRTQYWDANINQYEKDQRRHADVYVFSLLAHKDKATIDPLNMNQWQFYVLSTRILDDLGKIQKTLSLQSLEQLADPIGFHDIQEAVHRAVKMI